MTEVSIPELMERDPLEITNQELDALIGHYRKNRKAFLLEESGAAPKPKKTKQTTISEEALNDLLADL